MTSQHLNLKAQSKIAQINYGNQCGESDCDKRGSVLIEGVNKR